jgi:hypothetical protein
VKNRAFVRYTKNGKIVPGSMIVTNGSYPEGPAKWAEITTDLCCDDPGFYTTSKVKGFVRYTKDGNIVPGSLVLGEKPPVRNGSLWRDVSINLCCEPVFNLRTFLGTDTPGYPVGVWNVNDVYLGIADNATEYAALWNSDPDNQLVSTITPISTTSTSFKSTSPTDPGLRALRYYMYRGPANIRLYVGTNDIIKYGSTTLTGSVNGFIVDSDSTRDWNRYLLGSGQRYKTKIPRRNVLAVNCTGYTTSSDLYVFHNEDTEYLGPSFSWGVYYVEGNLPINTKAICLMAAYFNTDYNLITNWQELTSLWSFPMEHAGGGPWRYENAAFFPNLYRPSITQLTFGQMIGTGNLLGVGSFVNQTNYPNVSELMFTINSSLWGMGGNESWFLNMPKVNRYLSCVAGNTTQNTTAVSDLVWNNIATNLTGITPVVGSQAELAVRTTTTVSAASLVSRTYLAAQGWTVTLS